MQQNKDTKKIGTIEDSSAKNAYTIFHTLSKMKISRIGQFFNSVKRCGVDVSDILMILLMMPFYHIKSVPLLVKSGISEMKDIECSNSVFYDLKNNPKINWRSLLYLVALRFNKLSQEMNPEVVTKVRAFILDDSPLPKSGIKTELVSRMYDHVSCSYIFGCKILVLGYWDGLSFYPLDFSLHREKGNRIDKTKQSLETANKRLRAQRQKVKKIEKELSTTRQAFKLIKKRNKNKQTKSAIKEIEQATNTIKRKTSKLKKSKAKYTELENKAIKLRLELKETRRKHPDYGLTKKQMKQQFKKNRDPRTPGKEREAEADSKKTTNMMTMLKHAVRRGFRADYLLTDSWFFNIELVKLISKLGKKYSINLLSMDRIGRTKYKLVSNDRTYNAAELLVKFERKAITARSHNSKYIKVPVTYGGVRINLFFVKMGKSTVISK